MSANDENLPILVEIGGPPLDPEAARAAVRTRFWPKLLRVLGRVPFAEELGAVYFCARDPATPARAKAVVYAALAYFVMPADMIPDVIAGVGFTDDATVLTAALSLVGMHVKDAHRRAARVRLGRPEPAAED